MNKRPKLVVNFEKGQRLKLIAGWRTFLLLLQGFVPIPTPINHPLFGSWRGDEIHFITGGRTKQSETINEIMALHLLQGYNYNLTPYRVLGWKCHDLTRKLADLVASTPNLRDYCFEEMAGPGDDYSWLTWSRLRDLLRGIKTPLGPHFYHQYVVWLAGHYGLSPEVRQELREEIEISRLLSEAEYPPEAAVQQPSPAVQAVSAGPGQQP